MLCGIRHLSNIHDVIHGFVLEHARLSRNIGMQQVEEAIDRPYGLVFED